MEIFWYLWLLILAVFFYLKPNFIKNEKLFFIIWFTVACFTLLIVRLNDIDVIYGNKGGISDIGDYALAMKLTLTRMLGSNLIYIREPVVWFSLKGLYSLTNNELITFLVIDFISLYFLFRGMNSYKKFLDPIYSGNDGISIDIRYIYFGLFLFFPFALGMHSMYR